MLRHMVFFRYAMAPVGPRFDSATPAEEEAFTRAMLRAAPVPPRPVVARLTVPVPSNGPHGGGEAFRDAWRLAAE